LIAEANRLVLRHDSGPERGFRIRTTFGRQLARHLHASGSILREEHFILRPGVAGEWLIEVLPSAAGGHVRLNGDAITETRSLKSADRISVGPLVPGGEVFSVEVLIS
jgi:hypothetical protein